MLIVMKQERIKDINILQWSDLIRSVLIRVVVTQVVGDRVVEVLQYRGDWHGITTELHYTCIIKVTI